MLVFTKTTIGTGVRSRGAGGGAGGYSPPHLQRGTTPAYISHAHLSVLIVMYTLV